MLRSAVHEDITEYTEQFTPIS